MSKRPTFNDLIDAFGLASWQNAELQRSDQQTFEAACARRVETREALVHALRRAGLPLDQVAS